MRLFNMDIRRVENLPKSRMEWERSCYLLLEMGGLRFPKNVPPRSGMAKAMDSISKVRKLPNSRVDFLSIDELARNQINMAGNFKG
jgi:hypothetical protein